MEFEPMSPEQIERTVQFLLQQQAQFEANLARLSAKTDVIADGLIGLTGIVGRMSDGLRAELEENARQLRESREQLREADADLREHIRTVESHLNLLIEMFERHLREDHGPKPS
jgi:hypothetical protein